MTQVTKWTPADQAGEGYTFTLDLTSDDLQTVIDAAGGRLAVPLTWEVALRNVPEVGDGAVIEVTDPADRSAWIGDIADITREGDAVIVTVNVR